MEAKEHVQLYKPAKATDKKVEGEIKLTYIAPPTAQEILERKKQEEQQRLLELEEAKKKEAEDQLNLGKEANSEETPTGEAKLEEKS